MYELARQVHEHRGYHEVSASYYTDIKRGKSFPLTSRSLGSLLLLQLLFKLGKLLQ